ncbi:hypothetical protein TUSST3_71490 [Streptomyces sp. TUS-ST3]|nr:hypothetical protein TUSST3_71490 [Streptomyces sp. TUS-ST3]
MARAPAGASIKRAQLRHPDLHRVCSGDSRARSPLYVDIQDSAAAFPDLVEQSAALPLSAHRYHAWTHIPTTTDDD